MDPEDERWMGEALRLAREAGERDEVPVGAILVREGQIIGTGANATIGTHDATAHAEIVALRDAGCASGNHRLPGATMYVTIEPCMMCAGALVHARVARLVYGAREPKAGAVDSHAGLNAPHLNHRVDVEGGVLAQACGALVSDFFSQRRVI